MKNWFIEDSFMLSADADCSMNNPVFNDDVNDGGDGVVELVQSCCTLAWPWSEIEPVKEETQIEIIVVPFLQILVRLEPVTFRKLHLKENLEEPEQTHYLGT